MKRNPTYGKNEKKFWGIPTNGTKSATTMSQVQKLDQYIAR